MPLNTFGSYIFPFGSDLGGKKTHTDTHIKMGTRGLAEVAEFRNKDQAD